jgi:hypothetical protein
MHVIAMNIPSTRNRFAATGVTRSARGFSIAFCFCICMLAIASAHAELSFVQVNAATPQTAQSMVGVAYPNVQTAGDTNVVAVGWNDAVAAVTSVSDSRGNAYQLATGPISGAGGQSQSIYYASGIATGANTVTVTFSQMAQFVDLRIVEYGGIDPAHPLDVASGASGSGSPSGSGIVATTNPGDLLFAANMVAAETVAAGSGYTSRLITTPDSDIVEDRIVSVTGSYQATATLTGGDWVMQLVAFQAPPPGPPTVPAAPMNVSAVAGNAAATVYWMAADDGGSPILSYSVTSNPAGASASVGASAASADISGLNNGTAYTFSVVAHNAIGASAAATSSPVTPSATAIGTFPVVYSGDRRFLQDADGKAFPILGRSVWFITSLAASDYRMVIDDSVARGFNAIEFHVVNHDSRGNHPPFDGSGRLPFLQRLNGSSWNGSLAYGNSNEAPDFTTPNEDYWHEVDLLLGYCESKGVLALMFPAYAGYPNTDQGWMNEMLANGSTRMQSYGTWIANRYKNQKNLVWMMGGDRNFFNQEIPIENGLLQGLQSVTTQSRYFSAEWSSNTTGTNEPTFGSAMTLNSAYSWDQVTAQSRSAYAHVPAEPAFLLEEPYDEEGPDGNNVDSYATQPVRRYEWWGWLSTIGGYVAGNGYVWPFSIANWQAHLDTQGSRDLARLNGLIKTIAWWQLVPSELNGMKRLVTAGNSDPSSTDFIAAAANPAGSLLVAYVPPAHNGTFTIDMTALTATALARWFNPATGIYTTIGTIAPIGTQVFTPPGDNGSGYHDWALLLTAAPADEIFADGFQ